MNAFSKALELAGQAVITSAATVIVAFWLIAFRSVAMPGLLFVVLGAASVALAALAGYLSLRRKPFLVIGVFLFLLPTTYYFLNVKYPFRWIGYAILGLALGTLLQLAGQGLSERCDDEMRTSCRASKEYLALDATRTER
jgi:hypothetical protein